MKIGLISDTHGYIDDSIVHHLKDCDEIWHAGDIGSLVVMDRLAECIKVRAVYGNVDDLELRQKYPEELIFSVAGIKVYIIHIGGYPPNYTPKIRQRLNEVKPGLFICGHSHIVRIMQDPQRELLHINPGAAGRQGFHRKRSIVRFTISAGKIEDLQLIELGKRA